jgi:hypothetical protein
MRRALSVAGLAALAATTVFVLAFLLWGRGGPDETVQVPIPPDPAPAIQASADLSPRPVAFGDTVTARVDVTLDHRRVDADSVRIATDFAPWAPTADPERTRREGETTTHIRSTWTLRCLASACLPPGQPLRIPLTPATVTYDTLGDQAASGRRLTARWPLLIVNTRLETSVLNPSPFGSGTSPFETPWRADMVSMPPVSYRVDPETARVPLFAAAGAFALLGLALAYLGRPRRRPKPVLVPAEPPAPVLTPVEQALALLEDGVASNGAADRRRALELVAAELAGRGSPDLARVARTLAWSRQLPPPERTTPLAEEARPALGLAGAEDEDAEADAPDAEEARPGA